PGLFVRFEVANPARRLAQGLHGLDGVCAVVQAPFATSVVERAEAGELAVDHDADAGLDPALLEPLDVEGNDVAQTFPGERGAKRRDTLPMGPRRRWPLVGGGPGEEFVGGRIEGQVFPLWPADAGLAFQDRGPLDARQLPSDRPIDAPSEADLMAAALVDE